MDRRDQCCENCIYCEPHADPKEQPYCRRYPPQVFSLPNDYSNDLVAACYPSTESGQWCGEWEGLCNE